MNKSTTFAKSSITAGLALELVQKAQQKAVELELNVCVAVVDESGLLKCFSRMDGAPMLAIDIAKDKAWTAVSFGIPTDAWHDFIKNDPPLLDGITKVPRLIVFGGGYPIQIDGQVVGGIGVSGGHYSQDMACAKAALALLG
ncbi:MAG: heme-binding protein [Acidimicrobiia bacterium]|nr:heme-binding protein [Acidimicrobiia bacterium]